MVTGIQGALAELREAVASGKTESICLAYLALRGAATASGIKAPEMFERADRAISGSAIDVIASAFSHRHCFMCQNGVVPCDGCEGAGSTEAAGECRPCKGTGLTPCTFCQGTGWAPRDMIPTEFTPGVLRRLRLASTDRDLKDLAEVVGKLGGVKARRLPNEERRNLTAVVMRLQARVESLAEGEVASSRQRERLLTIASTLGTYLGTLRGS